MTDLIDDEDEFDEDDELYDDEDEAPPADFTDFDGFFDAEVRKITPSAMRLYDTEYVLPTEAPLAFSLIEQRLRDAEGIEPLREILTPVFGAEALDMWIAQGISERRLGIVLIWAANNMRQPGSCSIEQAIGHYKRMEADQGKAAAPNRAARRHGSGGQSSRTGRSSRRT